ncbi:type VI secretion system tip protein TssI/VgrG [Sorangium sp. So ce1024]|uniref:type VI secretion system tip protein TssI/VgrG n=1 Tax=Sorangium sp. So ce1024 TaxID=3133327 RepID=UPI003F0BA01F
MSDRPEHVFSLRVGDLPDAPLTVHAFRGQERLNGLYELTIDVTTEAEDVALEERAPGSPARLEIRHGDRRRAFHGIIAAARADGYRRTQTTRAAQYQVKLAPRAWLLGLRRNSRVFQNVRVDEVVRAILRQYMIPSRWQLEGRYPAREYCTQYEETDLEFILRLTAEHGIGFHFEQRAGDPDAPLGFGAQAIFEHARSLALGDGAEGAALGALGGAALGALGAAVDAGRGAAMGALGAAVDAGRGAALGALGGAAAGWLEGAALSWPCEVMVFTDSAAWYPPLALGDAPAPEMPVSHFRDGLPRPPEGLPRPPEGLPRPPGGRAGAVLHMRPDAGALQWPGEDTVLAFARGREVTTRSAAFRSYDPRRPHVLLGATRDAREGALLAGAAGALGDLARAGVAGALGDVAQVGAAALQQPDVAGALGGLVEQGIEAARRGGLEIGEGLGGVERPGEIYEHHSSFLFPDWHYERGEPDRILRSARRGRDVASGESVCHWLAPGHRFELEDHEIARLNRGWVPIAVVHEGWAPTSPGHAGRTYTNRFECVPADVHYPPERPPRRSVQVCLTATVVGGGATGIHTDPGAHIRVRFHWDRERRAASHDSCWVRVMQPWAGVGWGTQFIPRVGMEVVVTFEGGDPDKPLVLGCVYNGTSPPPFPLPQHATRSGIRTQSTPGAGGANELWFEDAAGQERVYVHAQKDLEIAVRNDRIARVDRDELMTVARDQRLRVDGEAHAHVRRSRETRVDEDDHLHVEGNRSSQTQGNASESVAQDRSVHVGGRSRVELAGQHDLLAKSDVIERMVGNFVRVVGQAEAKRSHITHVEGKLHSSSDTVEIEAEQGIVLRCGKSEIRMTAGKIQVSSPEIVLQGDRSRIRLMEGELRAQADSKIQAVSDQILLKSSGAGIGLSSEAAVEGSRILLNSPQSASDTVEESRVEPTVIELRDEDGQPIPNQPFRVVLEDGSEVAGVLDEDGRAVLELEGGGEVYFPGLTDVRQE